MLRMIDRQSWPQSIISEQLEQKRRGERKLERHTTVFSSKMWYRPHGTKAIQKGGRECSPHAPSAPWPNLIGFPRWPSTKPLDWSNVNLRIPTIVMRAWIGPEGMQQFSYSCPLLRFNVLVIELNIFMLLCFQLLLCFISDAIIAL